jgi:hypothetical protein
METKAGYLVIDHRASPGIPGSRFLCEGSLFEADTKSCSHCRISVVMNPDRVRARFTCPRCNEYCCDVCAAAYHENKVCKPFSLVIEEVKTGRTPVPILAKDMIGV